MRCDSFLTQYLYITSHYYIKLAGYSASLGTLRPSVPPTIPPSLPSCLPPSLPPCLPPSILSSLRPSLWIPGFTLDICSIIGQDNCIPEILFKIGCLVTLKWCALKLPLQGGWGWGVKNESIFSAVHEISRTFEMLTPKTSPPPPPGGVGVDFLVLIFWAVHDISRTLEFVCSQTVVSKKRGVQTHARTHTRTHTQRDTAAVYSRKPGHLNIQQNIFLKKITGITV